MLCGYGCLLLNNDQRELFLFSPSLLSPETTRSGWLSREGHETSTYMPWRGGAAFGHYSNLQDNKRQSGVGRDARHLMDDHSRATVCLRFATKKKTQRGAGSALSVLLVNSFFCLFEFCSRWIRNKHEPSPDGCGRHTYMRILDRDRVFLQATDQPLCNEF